MSRASYYKANKESILNKNELWRKNNPDKLKESQKRYYIKNREKILKRNKAWREANKDKFLSKCKEYIQNNKKEISKKGRAYYINNRNIKLEYRKNYYKENKDKIKIRNAEMYQKKKKDPVFRLRKNISRSLSRSINKNWDTNRYMEMFGYSVGELKKHLERQFTNGMAWDNYGIFWHIDHIRPVSSFNLKDEKEIIDCWSLYNLRPLEAKDNISKSNNLEFLI